MRLPQGEARDATKAATHAARSARREELKSPVSEPSDYEFRRDEIIESESAWYEG